MSKNIGYAAQDATSPLTPFPFDRREVGAEDVRIEIAFCGVCHSDVHQARDEFGGDLATTFPCMPGHEIVGHVVEVGERVTKHSVGDRVGVGCLVYWGSEEQREVLDEQYQNPPAVFTYNGEDPVTGDVTLGGYSDEIVVHEHFVLAVPTSLPLEQAAPLLCAGVTTWAPLEHFGIGIGSSVAVAGGGGLGHLAIKLAKARGADRVIALTRTPGKRDALLAAGADAVVDMTDEQQVAEHAASVDFLLSTIPTPFDFNPYISLLTVDGRLHSVGMLEPVLEGSIDMAAISMHRISISGSLIGNIAETQQVLDFCAEHGITADVEVIPVDRVNEAFDAMVADDVEFRYVIDNSTLPAAR